MSFIPIKRKGVVTPSLEQAKADKKAEINIKAGELIKAMEWKEDKRYKDEVELGLPLTMTLTEIAQERQNIRNQSNVLCSEVDALQSVLDVQSYQYTF